MPSPCSVLVSDNLSAGRVGVGGPPVYRVVPAAGAGAGALPVRPGERRHQAADPGPGHHSPRAPAPLCPGEPVSEQI